MSKIVQFEQKSLSMVYPSASEDEVPIEYELYIIEYKRAEIEKYPVGLWHSFLKKHYGPPLQCEGFLCKTDDIALEHNYTNKSKESVSFRIVGNDSTKMRFLDISEENLDKYQSGELSLDVGLINWKYFIKLPSEKIIVIETLDYHSFLRFGLINCKDDSKIHEGKRFISYLLDKLRKDAKNLINPKKWLKDNKVSFYFLWNGYLSNYLSGQQMLNVAEEQEDKLNKEMFKHDTYSVMTNFETQKYTEESTLCCGMYYSSAISYFFIAFEGFLNLIFHSFIKYELRDIDFETRFDIKQKIKLMPSLCYGFKNDKIDMSPELEKDFDDLKKFRNEVFHSKSGDNRLKSILTFQDGFIYTYQVDDFEDYFLPSHKCRLKAEDVNMVKSIVDSLIEQIIYNMEDDIRTLTEKYILRRATVPFVRNKDGIIIMGDSEIKF